MTRDKVLSMEPGRELDVLIGIHVMGWKWTPYKWWDGSTKTLLIADGWEVTGDDFDVLDDGNLLFWNMPSWSESIGAAWEVVEKMRPYEFYLFRTDGRNPSEEWVCIFSSGSGMEKKSWRAYAPTAELAICKAALLAVLGL